MKKYHGFESYNIKFETPPVTQDEINSLSAKLKEEIQSFKITKHGVADAAHTIEKRLEYAILNYFFKKKDDRSETFKLALLESDYQFSSKRKLIKIILNNLKFEKKEVDELDGLIGKTIRYRNAFVHGRASMEHGEFVIDYFEGERKRLIVNDERIDEISALFEKAYLKIDEINNKITGL